MTNPQETRRLVIDCLAQCASAWSDLPSMQDDLRGAKEFASVMLVELGDRDAEADELVDAIVADPEKYSRTESEVQHAQ